MPEQVGSAELFADQLKAAPQHQQFLSQRTLGFMTEGFSLRSSSRDPCSVGLAAPKDELTGLPLPVIITEPLHGNCNATFVDYHHSFHPERDLIYGDDAQIALRRSRGQNLPRWLHEHYHKFFAGPEFPQTREEIFGVVVLACAGVVPRQALYFGGTDGSPRIVNLLESETREIVVKSVRHEAEKGVVDQNFYRAQIGMFFANYAIEQSIEEVVSDRVIDEFLDTKVQSRRQELGNLLLREGIRMSVDPLRPVHEELKKEGLIRRRQSDLQARIQDFFVRSRRKDYHIALKHKWQSSGTVAQQG